MDRFNPEDLHKKGFVPDGKGGFKKATGHEKSLIEQSITDVDKMDIINLKIKQEKSLIEQAGEYEADIFTSQRRIKAQLNIHPGAAAMKLFEERGTLYVESALKNPQAKYITLTPDLRDMEQVATIYLEYQQIKLTKKSIAAAIKQIHRQEAEDFLMRRNLITEFYIPGEVRSTKNHTRIMKRRDGTRFIGKAAATVAAEKIQVWDYKGGAHAFRIATQDKPLPLFLLFTYIMSTDAHFDFLNLTQGPADQMQKCGWIRNDSRKHLVPVFNPRVYIHPEKTGVVISIL